MASKMLAKISSKDIIHSETHKGYLTITSEAQKEFISKECISKDFYVEDAPFARGKFAVVRRARCHTTGRWYAAKVMRRRRRAHDVRHEALHEIAVLALSKQCPRIVDVRCVYESPQEVAIVLQLAAGGELQRVVDEEECLEEAVVKHYMTHVLAALRFLHAQNIAHLDLKPQNLLLTGKHPDSNILLCDFGLARTIMSGIDIREILGTTDYVAPEVLQYEPLTLAADMWSVGVLAYVLLTGHTPFCGDTKQETFLNISQAQLDFPEDLFASVSPDAQDFISRLILLNPNKRMSVEKCLNHPWLSGTLGPSTSVVPSEPTRNQKRKASDTPEPECAGNEGHSKLPMENGCLREKENNRNSINRNAEGSGAYAPKPKSSSDLVKTVRCDSPRKDQKEVVKDSIVSSHKLSPLCLRRGEGSKCDLSSPGDCKFPVTLLVEKGVIC